MYEPKRIKVVPISLSKKVKALKSDIVNGVDRFREDHAVTLKNGQAWTRALILKIIGGKASDETEMNDDEDGIKL